MSEITLDSLMQKKNSETGTETQMAVIDETTAELQASFSPEEQAKIAKIKEQIDLTDSVLLTQYGIKAQQELSDFSDTVLNKVRAKDTGDVGELLSELVVQVKSIEDEGEKSIFSKLPFFDKTKKNAELMVQKYSCVESQIDNIESALENSKVAMLRDISVFDHLYDKNLEYFRNLQLYIQAGEEKLTETRDITLPKLREEAARTNDPMAAQVVSDFEEMVNRFEKKLHDLQLSRMIAIQTAPQIRLIQNADKQLVDRVQTAMLNTIPIWKSQMVIALGLNNQKKTLALQTEITEMTNRMLESNSEKLKMNVIETAKASEAGIVEIEVLQKANQNLIETIEQTIQIQKEGHAKRMEAEKSLKQAENDLKQKLLTARTN